MSTNIHKEYTRAVFLKNLQDSIFIQMNKNKIEGTPILKLAMVKRFKILCKPKVKSEMNILQKRYFEQKS